ncbi:MAG: hypothetical protein ABR576_14580 [Thermoanaerobaculia bacterium]
MTRPSGRKRVRWSTVFALAAAILFACRATVTGPRRPPPPPVIEVSFPDAVTMWVQDLVHWDGYVYGLFHHSGDPRVPGLWRVNVGNGSFTALRFVSGQNECRLPLNRFDIDGTGMRAGFFCAPGCDSRPCSSGEVHASGTSVMRYEGEVEGEWQPALHRGPGGSIDGWRYTMEALRHPEGDSPGRFLLERTEKRSRGRE